MAEGYSEIKYAASGEVRSQQFDVLPGQARWWVLQAFLGYIGAERGEGRQLEAMRLDLSRLVASHPWGILPDEPQEVLEEVLRQVEARLDNYSHFLLGLNQALWAVTGMGYEEALARFHALGEENDGHR